MTHYTVIFIGTALFILGMIFLARALFKPGTDDIAAGMETLGGKITEEVEMRKRDEEIIQSLQRHIDQLEREYAGKTAREDDRKEDMAELGDLMELVEENRKAANGIKRRIEENRVKFSLQD